MKSNLPLIDICNPDAPIEKAYTSLGWGDFQIHSQVLFWFTSKGAYPEKDIPAGMSFLIRRVLPSKATANLCPATTTKIFPTEPIKRIDLPLVRKCTWMVGHFGWRVYSHRVFHGPILAKPNTDRWIDKRLPLEKSPSLISYMHLARKD